MHRMPINPSVLTGRLAPGRLQKFARSRTGFLAVHLLPLAYGFGLPANLLGTIAVWFVLQFAIHAGYHRYFTHRAYKTRPWVEFLLGAVGAIALQNGPIWWAAKHRQHHRNPDSEHDPHTPVRGRLHAHIGWLWGPQQGTIELSFVQDLLRPIPIWIELHQRWIVLAWIAFCLWYDGLAGLVGLWAMPTILCWHATFATNSLCHSHHCDGRRELIWGANNNAVLALVNLGEGWHAYHHARPSVAHHGWYRWYEVDITYVGLRLLETFGLVWDLRRATAPP